MKNLFFSNFMLKLVALVLAIITWFYISGEMKRQAAGQVSYAADQK